MATSIADFKKAFAGTAADDGLKERNKQTVAALNQLKAAVDQAGEPDAFKSALKTLVERYDAVRKQPRGAADELDEVYRQTKLVTSRVESAPIAAPPPPPMAAPAPPSPSADIDFPPAPSSAEPYDPDKRGGLIAVHYLIVDKVSGDPVKGAYVEVEVGRNAMYQAVTITLQTDARGWVGPWWNKPNGYDITVSSPVHETRTFSYNVDKASVFGVAQLNKKPVKLTVTVVDSKTGAPVDRARIHWNDFNNTSWTDRTGKAQIVSNRAPANTRYKIEATKPGYESASEIFFTGERDWEKTLRLTPIPPEQLDKVVLGVTVRSIKTKTPIPKAVVTFRQADLIETPDPIRQKPMTVPTDGDGFMNFTLLPGYYEYSVTADGFEKLDRGFHVLYQSKVQEFLTIDLFEKPATK